MKILFAALFSTTILISCNNQSEEHPINKINDDSAAIETSDDTKRCLINVDWVYPNNTNPTAAWKFSSDGTFNSSTTAFGGMSTWGNWEILVAGKIKISYTKTSVGSLPDDQILMMTSCNSLKVGSTVYHKE